MMLNKCLTLFKFYILIIIIKKIQYDVKIDYYNKFIMLNYGL